MNDNLENNERENFAGSIVEIPGFIGIIIKSFLNCPDYGVRGSNDFQIREFGKRILNILKYITMLDLRNRKLASAYGSWCLGFMLTGTTL